MNLDDIRTFIRERRWVLGITLKDLAALSGIGINTLNQSELGQANPMFSILMGLFGKAEVSHSITDM